MKNELSIGKIGEAFALEYLSDEFKTVLDVRNDKSYQKEDVDFLVSNNEGIVCKIEVKTDTQAFNTGNIAYETTSFYGVGCFERTKADVVMYFALNENSMSGRMYHIDVRKIKKFVLENPHEVHAMGEKSNGYLLSIAELEQKGVIYKSWDIGKT